MTVSQFVHDRPRPIVAPVPTALVRNHVTNREDARSLALQRSMADRTRATEPEQTRTTEPKVRLVPEDRIPVGARILGVLITETVHTSDTRHVSDTGHVPGTGAPGATASTTRAGRTTRAGQSGRSGPAISHRTPFSVVKDAVPDGQDVVPAGQEAGAPVMAFGGELTLDPDRRLVLRKGTAIDLTRREFDLLHVFLRSPGRVHTRVQLLTSVWGYQRASQVTTRTVDVHVHRLRDKLGQGFTSGLKTRWGIGYQWVPTATS